MTNGPLTALAGGGVYAYGASNTFPTSTYQATNYWVDVVYSQTSGATVPGAPSGVSATAGNGSASVSWTAPGNGGSAITSYTVTPYIGSAAQTPVTVSGSPPATTATVTGLTNGTSYTFTVSATNAVGTGPASSPSNAVTPNRRGPSVTSVTPSSGATGVAVSAAPSVTFSAAGDAEHGVVHGEGLGREQRGRDGGLQRREHGGDVHADQPAGGQHHLHRDGVGGAECLGHADEQPVLVELHHRRRWPQCPCSIWQDGTPAGAVDATDTSADDAGGAVPGLQQRVHHRGPVLQGGG